MTVGDAATTMDAATTDVPRMDASRTDASRTDAPRTDATRVDARADVHVDAAPRDVSAPRDAGGTPTVPTGNVRIFRMDLPMQCFEFWNEEGNPDDGSLFLNNCTNDFVQSWRFVPIAGRTGVYQIKSSAWDDGSCLVAVPKTNGNSRLRIELCDEPGTQAAWRINFDPGSPTEFQIVSDATPTTCVSLDPGGWGYMDTCDNTTSFYFTTNAF